MTDYLKKKSRNDIISGCLFLLEILLLFVLSSFFIPTVDDLIFRFRLDYNNVLEFVHNVVYYGNGRLLGNGLLLFFCRHTGWFYALQTVLTALFAIIIEKIVGLKYSRHFVMAFILIQPIPVFNTTFAWMSSFINYYIPTIFLSVTVLLLMYILKDRITTRFLLCVFFFVIGIAQQLFVEINAAVNVVVSFVFLLSFIRKRKNPAAPAVLFAANVIGLGIILLFTKFLDITKTFTYSGENDGYRKTIFSGSLSDAVNIIVKNFRYPVFILAVFFFFFISLAVAVIYTAKKKNIYDFKVKIPLAVSVVAYIPLCILGMYINIKYPVDFPDTERNFLLVVGIVVLLLAVSYMIMFALLYRIVIRNIKHKIPVIFSFLFGILSYAPFLVVFPSGNRCCELFLFFFMVSYLFILSDLKELYGFNVFQFTNVCALSVVAIIIVYLFVFPREKKIYHYKNAYYATMKYLPQSNEVIVMHGDNLNQWDYAAGFAHEYIPLDEFEQMINEN